MPEKVTVRITTCSATLKPGWSALIHGVSAKHLPRYLREWSYRFNLRNLPDGLEGYLIRRAVECATCSSRIGIMHICLLGRQAHRRKSKRY